MSNVRKQYHIGKRTVDALRGIDLTIDRPGFFAIMGASGSGKSTLLHLLAGLDTPDGGSIVINNSELHSMDERALTEYRRHKIGMIFQQFNLIPTMTALQNVILPGMLDGTSASELEPRGKELLQSLGVIDRATHRPDALSGGEQQRVAIARSLLFSPTVIFADEPTGNLDSESSEQVWQVLSTLAQEQNVTVLTVTHEPAAAVHCETVHCISDGRMKGTFHVDGADATELATRYQQLVRA